MNEPRHPNMQVLEAAAFQRLVKHLQARQDITNADLMATAGFCRNCLVEWLVQASMDTSTPLTQTEMRDYVYGESYAEFKQRQPETTAEQRRRIDESIQSNIAHGETGPPETRTELDKELADSFPASDPPATTTPG